MSSEKYYIEFTSKEYSLMSSLTVLEENIVEQDIVE